MRFQGPRPTSQGFEDLQEIMRRWKLPEKEGYPAILPGYQWNYIFEDIRLRFGWGDHRGPVEFDFPLGWLPTRLTYTLSHIHCEGECVKNRLGEFCK